MSNPTRGLQREITLRLGARLVQEGNRLHYLADRASIIGQFSKADLHHLNQAVPFAGEANGTHAHKWRT